MNIEDLTIGQAKELLGLFPRNENRCFQPPKHPWKIGETYFIRTVTHHYTGRLLEVFEQELLLSDAAWIADDGRFAQAVEKGTFNEVEPFKENVIIGRASIIDATIVRFAMPRSTK